MTALYIILVVIVLILLMPVGVDGGYDFGDVRLKIVAGPAKIQFLPKKEKKKGKEKKEKAPKAKKEKKPKAKPQMDFAFITELVRLGLRALNRFRKKLNIDHLQIWYLAAADDPCDAAMAYGKASAAVSLLRDIIYNAFNVKDEDIRLRVDFTEEKPQFSVMAQLTIRIGQILFIALCAGIGFLQIILKQRKQNKLKAERIDKNGEASYRRNDGDHNVQDKGNGGCEHSSGHTHNNA